jgi:hypothetical protein
VVLFVEPPDFRIFPECRFADLEGEHRTQADLAGMMWRPKVSRSSDGRGGVLIGSGGLFRSLLRIFLFGQPCGRDSELAVRDPTVTGGNVFVTDEA